MSTSNPPPIIERMLTRAEAADLLRVSQWTLDSWCKAGKLRAVRLGGGRRGRVVFDPADLREFVNRAKAAHVMVEASQ